MVTIATISLTWLLVLQKAIGRVGSTPFVKVRLCVCLNCLKCICVRMPADFLDFTLGYHNFILGNAY